MMKDTFDVYLNTQGRGLSILQRNIGVSGRSVGRGKQVDGTGLCVIE